MIPWDYHHITDILFRLQGLSWGIEEAKQLAMQEKRKWIYLCVPLELPWSPGRSIQSNKVNRKYDVADIPMLHRHFQCQLVSLLQVQHLTCIDVLIPLVPPYTFGKIIRYLTVLRLFILSWKWALRAIVGGGCDMSMTVSASLELFL